MLVWHLRDISAGARPDDTPVPADTVFSDRARGVPGTANTG